MLNLFLINRRQERAHQIQMKMCVVFLDHHFELNYTETCVCNMFSTELHERFISFEPDRTCIVKGEIWLLL